MRKYASLMMHLSEDLFETFLLPGGEQVHDELLAVRRNVVAIVFNVLVVLTVIVQYLHQAVFLNGRQIQFRSKASYADSSGDLNRAHGRSRDHDAAKITASNGGADRDSAHEYDRQDDKHLGIRPAIVFAMRHGGRSACGRSRYWAVPCC